MLLLPVLGVRVLVLEDEVNLFGRTDKTSSAGGVTEALREDIQFAAVPVSVQGG